MSVYGTLCSLFSLCELFNSRHAVKVTYENISPHIIRSEPFCYCLSEKVSHPHLHYVWASSPALPGGPGWIWAAGTTYGLSVRMIVKCIPLVNDSIEGKSPQLPSDLFVSSSEKNTLWLSVASTLTDTDTSLRTVYLPTKVEISGSRGVLIRWGGSVCMCYPLSTNVTL